LSENFLGIESTAHTFSASIVSSSGKILSNVKSVYTAERGHGIHPFKAAEFHRENAADVILSSLSEASLGMDELKGIGYSMGPGLGPCLRVGAVVARTLALSFDKPIIPVNHAVGHIELGCMLTGAKDPLVLLVSGGHTMILCFSSSRWRVMGETLDITLGQLLDQFGRHAGLGSPCGSLIEKAASKSKNYIQLPYTVKGNDVSFSGILTQAKKLYDEGFPFEDICFSIQETSFAMICEATERALAFTEKKELLVVGGVASNKRLSSMLSSVCRRHRARLLTVPPEYSGDNGAQIAWTAYLCYRSGLSVRPEEACINQSWRLDTVDIPWREEAYLQGSRS
jgi:N6-L-threonylcarbamoyladenine synthase